MPKRPYTPPVVVILDTASTPQTRADVVKR